MEFPLIHFNDVAFQDMKGDIISKNKWPNVLYNEDKISHSIGGSKGGTRDARPLWGSKILSF